jgi:hypothetical protein
MRRWISAGVVAAALVGCAGSNDEKRSGSASAQPTQETPSATETAQLREVGFDLPKDKYGVYGTSKARAEFQGLVVPPGDVRRVAWELRKVSLRGRAVDYGYEDVTDGSFSIPIRLSAARLREGRSPIGEYRLVVSFREITSPSLADDDLSVAIERRRQSS